MKNILQAQIIYDAFDDIMHAVMSAKLPSELKYRANEKVYYAYKDILNAIGYDTNTAYKMFSKR